MGPLFKKKKLFSAHASKPSMTLKSGMGTQHEKHLKLLKSWITLAIIMVLVMIVLGGLTRLTGSGLSMVTWQPLKGFLPPLTLADWESLFGAYQASPEFRLVNPDMTLEGFKNIFWLEYIHRVWGRLVGLVFLVPIFLSLRAPHLRRSYTLPLVGIWSLGACQGILGWVMVKSGLHQNPHVNPYILSFHLSLAAITFCFLVTLWSHMTARQSPQKIFTPSVPFSFKALSWGTFLITFMTLFYGGIVAGMKAGLLYNTFPFMGENIWPDELLSTSLTFQDFFKEPALVQMTHRLLALTTFLSSLALIMNRHKLSSPLQGRVWGFMGIVVVQIALGAITILTQVSLFWAVVHQLCAFFVLGKLVWLLSGIHQKPSPLSLSSRFS